MSYLTPEKIPVGYSLTRRRAEEGYKRENLPRFERIPRWKMQGLPILWKFRKLDKSIVVVTEGLGPQAFHGKIVLLVNRHTISGAEIVVQFAKEHGLAVIVGERTAGKSLSFGTPKEQLRVHGRNDLESKLGRVFPEPQFRPF